MSNCYLLNGNNYLLTSDQIRGSRSFLKLNGKELSVKFGVGCSTIIRLETEDGVQKAQAKTLKALRRAFESAGIEFLGFPKNGAEVRRKLK